MTVASSVERLTDAVYAPAACLSPWPEHQAGSTSAATIGPSLVVTVVELAIQYR